MIKRESVHFVVEATMINSPKMWIELANFEGALVYAREYRDMQRELADSTGSSRQVRVRKVTTFKEYEEVE